jgi:VIT1/CCC1 family predicted Fe2+/Mn2+ transporter
MAMQMNSVVHVSTSPSPSPATSPPPEGKQEHGEVAAVHVVGVGDDEAVMVVKDEEAFGGGGVDYSGRAQWLRAAVLGANDGLVSVASLMIGVGAVSESGRAMLVSGVAGLVAGACSMAIGEFVSVCSQRDVELAQLERDGKRGGEEEKALPSPAQAAAASAMAFSVGAVVPLLAAGFIVNYRLRIAVVVAVASVALAAFGCVGAVLGRAAVARSSARVVLGGWAAMGITFGLMRLFKASGI